MRMVDTFDIIVRAYTTLVGIDTIYFLFSMIFLHAIVYVFYKIAT